MMEKFTRNSRSTGILAGLQADGWQTVAFNTHPTVDMTYLFKRRLQRQAQAAEDKPFSSSPIYSQTPRPYPRAEVSQHQQ
jgi:hypothetical protein